MEFTVQIDEPFDIQVAAEPIEKALQTTFRHFTTVTTGTVSVVVTDNNTVQQFNHQYRGIDAPTDVLSFENILDPDFPSHDSTVAPHLGDIIIAYPIAEAQARVAGHAPPEEVILLAVHGALHLLGFDHDTPENKANMWAIQEKIMTDLGLTHIQPTES